MIACLHAGLLVSQVTYGTLYRDPVLYETSWPESAEMAISTIYVSWLPGSAMTPAIC